MFWKKALPFLALLFFTIVPAAEAIGARHAVIVVWDGMRPDFVSEKTTPTLWKLAREGVTFRNHHPVYPSATQVNGTAIVTGVYPGRSGVIANYVYRREIDPKRSISVENPAVVQKGDELRGGKYIGVPTITELIQRAGRRTAVASAKTVGLLLDRFAGTQSAGRSATLFAGNCLPAAVLAPIVKSLGPFPSAHLERDAWTTKAMKDFLWSKEVPALSILWLGEPDLTQHESAPGAPAALAAIKSSDDQLAAILGELERRGERETTDVFVVSDHGFSTIRRSIDLRKILNGAGFIAKTEFDAEPKPGDIMLVGNGGSVLFYVTGADATVTRRLVEFLQRTDFAGVIFGRKPIEGTFGLDQAGIQSDSAPDVVMAFRWNDAKNQFGVPGMIDADWQRAAGEGTHVTLSRFDMHNLLIAAGPDIRRGKTDELPTGNIDLAPTILHILGIPPAQKMDGRVLFEALVGDENERAAANLRTETRTIDCHRDLPGGVWQQSLKISRVGSTVYLDEGNGEFVPAGQHLR